MDTVADQLIKLIAAYEAFPSDPKSELAWLLRTRSWLARDLAVADHLALTVEAEDRAFLNFFRVVVIRGIRRIESEIAATIGDEPSSVGEAIASVSGLQALIERGSAGGNQAPSGTVDVG